MIEHIKVKEKKIVKKNKNLSKSSKNSKFLLACFFIPFTLLWNCFLKTYRVFKSQVTLISKKPKGKKKYQRITFNSTNNNELAKLSISTSSTRKFSNGNGELFSPNINKNNANQMKVNQEKNNEDINDNSNNVDRNSVAITITPEENDNIFIKTLANLKKASNNRRHMIFQKIIFANGNSFIKKKNPMPGTDTSLEKYIEMNNKYIFEKNDNLLLKSKELEETLIQRLSQPIILRNKRIVVKNRPKKKFFMPTILTPIYEDLDYS